MIYFIGVDHYVQHVRGPHGESFAQFLRDEIKTFRIVFVAEALTNENPAERQVESTASRVAKMLAIDYRVCDETPKKWGHSQRISGTGADAFLTERCWLAKIED